MVRRVRLLGQLWEECKRRDGRPWGDTYHDVKAGQGLLDDSEPERHARMLDSIAAGRVAAVADLLQVYWRNRAS